MTTIDTPPQDPLWAPLSGSNLIEASAGTGKTFTIAGLYLRLVVEAQWPVSQILVITFTRAATQELRERIRDRLESAQTALRQGASNDGFLQTFIDRLEDHQRAQLLLQRAVQSFDRAAIFTIHGFCQRALTDHAFEGGQPFERTLLTDQEELIQEVFNDFWRREMATADPFFVAYLREKVQVTPADLASNLRPYLGNPHLDIRQPAPPGGDCERAATDYREAFQELRGIWQAEGDTAAALLLDHLPSLNGKQYTEAKLTDWLEQLEGILTQPEPPLSWFNKATMLTASQLQDSTKKQGTVPHHRCFQAVETTLDRLEHLKQCLDHQYRTMLVQALYFAQAELPRRKAERGVQHYNDLLLNLHEALDGAEDSQLAEALRRRYPVALIDEFQDTDPLQYTIFRRIYDRAEAPSFLVGDPKQAIYAFRGADVFAYLDAQRHIRDQPEGQRHQLPYNWRSHPRLVEAFNGFFEQREKAFWLTDIPYKAVRPAPVEQPELVLPENFDPAPFQWWLVPPSEEGGGNPMNKGRARQLGAQATAQEIARLLASARRNEAGFRLPDGGWQALHSKDMAVLVRTHADGQRVRKALSERGIPSAEHAQASVYQSGEAQGLEQVLLAVADPHSEGLVRGALTTDFHGFTGETLYRLSTDEAWRDRIIDFFQGLHDQWRRSGFIAMFRQWLQGEEDLGLDPVRSRLLGLPQGERRLTNLIHLGELLQAQTVAEDLGPEGLLHYLAGKRQEDSQAGEEEQLRLESDEDLVQIVTFHRSKGLEYPVVFCPFLWDLAYRDPDDAAIPFHDPEADFAATLDFGSEEQGKAKECHHHEDFAEKLRLLYVAVTRAAQRVYAATGRINGVADSPLGYLLHSRSEEELNAPEEIAEAVVARSDADFRGDLERLAEAYPDNFAVEALTEEPAHGLTDEAPSSPEPLRERPWRGGIPSDPVVTSFTGLIEGHPREQPGTDPGEAVSAQIAPASPTAQDRAARFPRGPVAGTCLHAALERIDFTSEPEEWAIPVGRSLREQGFDAEQWGETVTGMVANTVATPLGGELGAHSLQAIDSGARLDEMAFYYPLARLTDSALSGILAEYGYHPGATRSEAGPALVFRPQEGYLRGFIDLVFEANGRYYLADYKSNWLGPDAAAYTPATLAEAVADHGYALQYLLYSVALHRHLKTSLPGYRYAEHFGGAYYLFLRGMDPELGEGAGVYFDSPDEGLIEALDGLFRGEG